MEERSPNVDILKKRQARLTERKTYLNNLSSKVADAMEGIGPRLTKEDIAGLGHPAVSKIMMEKRVSSMALADLMAHMGGELADAQYDPNEQKRLMGFSQKIADAMAKGKDPSRRDLKGLEPIAVTLLREGMDVKPTHLAELMVHLGGELAKNHRLLKEVEKNLQRYEV